MEHFSCAQRQEFTLEEYAGHTLMKPLRELVVVVVARSDAEPSSCHPLPLRWHRRWTNTKRCGLQLQLPVVASGIYLLIFISLDKGKRIYDIWVMVSIALLASSAGSSGRIPWWWCFYCLRKHVGGEDIPFPQRNSLAPTLQIRVCRDAHEHELLDSRRLGG